MADKNKFIGRGARFQRSRIQCRASVTPMLLACGQLRQLFRR
jgi:hypothetical protein